MLSIKIFWSIKISVGLKKLFSFFDVFYFIYLILFFLWLIFGA